MYCTHELSISKYKKFNGKLFHDDPTTNILETSAKKKFSLCITINLNDEHIWLFIECSAKLINYSRFIGFMNRESARPFWLKYNKCVYVQHLTVNSLSNDSTTDSSNNNPRVVRCYRLPVIEFFLFKHMSIINFSTKHTDFLNVNWSDSQSINLVIFERNECVVAHRYI